MAIDCLEEFDTRIPEIIENMREDDLLAVITADHSNDPPTLVLIML